MQNTNYFRFSKFLPMNSLFPDAFAIAGPISDTDILHPVRLHLDNTEKTGIFVPV